MKILVTGGAGFIGSNFVHLLMARTSHVVVNLDCLTYAGNRANCEEFENSDRYAFVQGDIADGELVDRLLGEGVDAVVNFAAESHVDRSIHDSTPFIHTNILGTQTLLDAARRHKTARFVHISTDEVYGDLDEDEPRFTEGSPIKPSSPYAASKAAADLLVLAAFRTHHQPVLITRCSNNYGPFQHPEKLIPLTILRASQDETIPIYGQGTNIRDWIHVTDHCQGILAVLERGREGSIYNLGGRSERRNIDVARTILRLLHKDDDLLRYVTDRPGHDRRYAIDFSMAERELGWHPTVTFEDGLANTIRWYETHCDWLQQMASDQFRQFCSQHYGEVP